jgi:hypothetical protein
MDECAFTGAFFLARAVASARSIEGGQKPDKTEVTMSTQTTTENTTRAGSATAVDLKLEVVVLPVSDVERAKAFYGSLGWRLDVDFASGED